MLKNGVFTRLFVEPIHPCYFQEATMKYRVVMIAHATRHVACKTTVVLNI
jgi:hypothetical protein